MREEKLLLEEEEKMEVNDPLASILSNPQVYSSHGHSFGERFVLTWNLVVLDIKLIFQFTF